MIKTRKFKFKLVGESPILMNKPASLKDMEKQSKLPPSERAEALAYRTENGNLGIPRKWLKGALVNAFIRQKTSASLASQAAKAEKQRVSPRIWFTEEILDLNIDKYEIDTQIVLVKTTTGDIQTVAEAIRPKVTDWEVEGVLVTTLPDSKEELEETFQLAGSEVGIGSNRINGYGRFRVTEFTEIQ